ncbi:hypothetical protein DPMN_178832 [Dreissena polymorpha]|uniref:Uncharacterized protein n=1 Tax=Dreissena polymorpha TaxID=45954 RepID=A0A9D4EFT6_DREPO|nr:hypothetical protein DPMN_178832 [Dreissena polymorpha]
MDFERNERQLCKKTPPMGLATNRMDAMPAGIAMLFFRRGQWTRHDRLNGLDVTDST